MKALALDPGFAVTGWAAFHLAGPPSSFTSALRGLTSCGKIETDSREEDHRRLAYLGLRLRDLLAIHRPDVVYVEVPAFFGDYGNDPGRRKGANKLYMALGAIYSRLDLLHVVPVPAIRVSKDDRNALLEAAARAAGVELPSGPRGGARQNQTDAIWLGAKALEDRVGWPAA